jgi:hypothetical protein
MVTFPEVKLKEEKSSHQTSQNEDILLKLKESQGSRSYIRIFLVILYLAGICLCHVQSGVGASGGHSKSGN